MAQVSGGQAVAATAGSNTGINKSQPQPPMSLMQMLNKSQQDDAQRAAAQQGLLGPQSPNSGPQQMGLNINSGSGPHVPNDLVLKLHQVQQHQVNKISPTTYFYFC